MLQESKWTTVDWTKLTFVVAVPPHFSYGQRTLMVCLQERPTRDSSIPTPVNTLLSGLQGTYKGTCLAFIRFFWGEYHINVFRRRKKRVHIQGHSHGKERLKNQRGPTTLMDRYRWHVDGTMRLCCMLSRRCDE